MGFVNFRFLCLLATVALVLVLQITAVTYPWYQYYGKHHDDPEYKWTEYLAYVEYEESDTGVVRSCYYKSCNGSVQRVMWFIILGFVIAAIFLTTIETLVLFTWAVDFCHRLKFRSKLRTPLIVIAYLAAIATFGAWLILFMHPLALENLDLSLKFASDNSGPQAGWCLFVASSAISLHAAIVLSMSGSPDPATYQLLVNSEA